MTRGNLALVLHFFLLVIAAVATLIVFSEKEKPAFEKAAPLLDVALDDIDRIVFSSDTKIVEIIPRKKGGYTLTVFKRDDDVPDPDSFDKEEEPEEIDTSGEAELEGETETKRYRASKSFDDKLKKIFPLEAKRSLGQVAPGELGRFGFAKGGKALSIKAKGQTVRFEVGDSNYGGATTYLRQKPDGAVFLVASDVIRTLDITAPRYMERRLVGVEKDNATSVTVIAEGKTRQMVSVGSGKEKKWASAEEPEKPVEMLGNWVGALFRLSAKEYLAEDEVPALTPLAEIELDEEGAPAETLELAWTDAEDEKKDYFAKSDFTGAWVGLSRFSAESVASDLPSILQSE